MTKYIREHIRAMPDGFWSGFWTGLGALAFLYGYQPEPRKYRRKPMAKIPRHRLRHGADASLAYDRTAA